MSVPPLGPPPVPPPAGGTPYPYLPYPPHPPQRTNAYAVASLICAFLFAPLGVLFGHLSLSQIKRSGEQGRGLAIAGLVIGYVITVGTVLVLVMGALLLSWAAKVVRENPQLGASGQPGRPSTTLDGSLPPFAPPAGLGSACAYPATPTAAAKPVKPPRGGKVAREPAALQATMRTDEGTVGLRLDNAEAPCTVHSFVSLARQGYFDDTPCHRLATAPDLSMLQCGDPTGTGAGGPGYRFANEYPTNQYRPLDPELRQPVVYPRGTLAMANSGPGSNGSQFFNIYRDSTLQPTYTVFGRVDDRGLAVVERLAADGVRGGGTDGPPRQPITITAVTVR